MNEKNLCAEKISSGQSPAVKKNLDSLFHPGSVAVVGASANQAKIGYQLMNNIVGNGFAGEIYPIHPKEQEILGRKAYPSVKDVPGSVDFAVIAVPAPFVAGVLEECGQKGVKGVVIITSGFAEVGKTEDEEKLKEIADRYGIAFVGPNTLGLVYMPAKLNASFGPKEILSGKIAFISQSGALAISLMGWTMMERIGLASLVSLGNKADVDEVGLIEYFNNDDNVDVIVIYMEGIKHGTEFLRTEIRKPVIVLKVGRSSRGAKAAASHTGSLAGSDKVNDAAFKQIGILRADTFAEAFAWSRALSLPEPKGKETLIITNGGGIGVAATDACEKENIALMEDPQWLEEKFRKTMPDFGSTKNPVDITGQGGVEGYRQAAEIAFREDRVKSIIVLYCETAVTDPFEIAKAVESEYEKIGRSKPIVVSMVGGERSRKALQYLNEHHIPAYASVNEAVSALEVVYRWQEIRTRPKDNPADDQAPKEAVEIIEKVKAEGRDALLEHEARKVLELCGVPTPKWGFAKNFEEAKKEARDMYPLAMKIASPDILHKTDVGGVVVDIRSEAELKEKYNAMMDRVKKAKPQAKILGVNLIEMISGIECIIGMSRDPQFGPVVMFGLGGVFVEALKDVAFRVVPFGKIEAERLMEDIQAKKVLEGFRGLKANKQAIIQTLCAVQKLAPLVKEIDINPLMANKDGAFAVDARILL